VATLSFLASGWIVSLGGLSGYKALSYNNLSTSLSLEKIFFSWWSW
jgi:hypothetical protein